MSWGVMTLSYLRCGRIALVFILGARACAATAPALVLFLPVVVGRQLDVQLNSGHRILRQLVSPLYLTPGPIAPG